MIQTIPFPAEHMVGVTASRILLQLLTQIPAYKGRFLNKIHFHFSVTLCVQPDASIPAELGQEPLQVSLLLAALVQLAHTNRIS